MEPYEYGHQGPRDHVTMGLYGYTLKPPKIRKKPLRT